MPFHNIIKPCSKNVHLPEICEVSDKVSVQAETDLVLE